MATLGQKPISHNRIEMFIVIYNDQVLSGLDRSILSSGPGEVRVTLVLAMYCVSITDRRALSFRTVTTVRIENPTNPALDSSEFAWTAVRMLSCDGWLKSRANVTKQTKQTRFDNEPVHSDAARVLRSFNVVKARDK
jgi:hypothetical protein